MKRLFASLALLACAGCVPIPIGGGNYIVPVNGVQIQIFNHCTPIPGRITPSVGSSWTVPAGGPTNLYIPYVGGSALATYTVLGGANGNVVIGTISRDFGQGYGSLRRVQWIIGGNSQGGGNDIAIDHLYDRNGRVIC